MVFCRFPSAAGWEERQSGASPRTGGPVTQISDGTVFGDGWRFYGGLNSELQFISIKGNVERDFIAAKSSDFIKISCYAFVLVWGLCFEGEAASCGEKQALRVSAFTEQPPPARHSMGNL